MSTRLGDALPDSLLDRLSGQDLAAVADQAIVMCSVDDGGYPHVALLSYFEIIAIDHRQIRLAIYGDSTMRANARRDAHVTLIVIHERAAYYIKGTVEELGPSMRAAPYSAKLHMRIASVLADAADPVREPGAYIAGGMTYVHPSRAADLDRAQRVLAELLE